MEVLKSHIAIVKPGIAPANIPAKVPTNINPKVTGSKTILANACRITSIIFLPNSYYFPFWKNNLQTKSKNRPHHTYRNYRNY
jgi:hypothetical protein